MKVYEKMSITPKSHTFDSVIRSMKKKPSRRGVEIGSWILEEDLEGRLVAKKGEYVLIIGNGK